MDRTLIGAHVQRVALVRAGRRDVALLKVRVPGQTVHVVVASGLGIGVMAEDRHAALRQALRGLGAPAQALWRARLEGARIDALTEHEVELTRDTAIRILDRDDRLELTTSATLDPPTPPAPLSVSSSGEPRLEARPAFGAGGGESEPWQTWTRRGEAIAAGLERAGSLDRRETLRRALAKAVARVARRVEAVRGDLNKMGAAQAAAETARLFVVEAARAPRGTRELRAADWSRVSPNGEPEMVAMRLDPAKPPQAQLDAIFNRARRLKEGARIAQARLDEAAQAHAALAELAAKLTESDADFDALEAAARAAAPRDFKMGPRPAPGARHARSGEAKPPFRTFAGGTEAKILVGRGALQNDALTLRVARPHDLWLHAKGFTGAHVVVPLPKGASCPAEVLVEAAHLAAHFSDARTEALVEVTYTPRRYVRKPRGSAPGAVVVDREKVIVLRKDDELLRALLAAEIDP